VRRRVVEQRLIRRCGDATERLAVRARLVADFVVVLVDEIAHQVERRDDGVIRNEGRGQRREKAGQDQGGE
jgi:hypothetical protein